MNKVIKRMINRSKNFFDSIEPVKLQNLFIVVLLGSAILLGVSTLVFIVNIISIAFTIPGDIYFCLESMKLSFLVLSILLITSIILGHD